MQAFPPPRQILIVQTAFIGDVILATALAEKLHRAFPQAAIDFMLRKGNEGLFEEHPFIRQVLVFDKGRGKYRRLFGLVGRIRRTRYDLLVNVQRFFTTGLLTVLSGAGHTSGFSQNPWSRFFSHRTPFLAGGPEAPHETARNQQLIAHIAAGAPALPRLYPAQAQADKARALAGSGPYVCFCPGSVWFTKQCPAEKWVAVANSLPSGTRILFLGAPQDRPLCDSLIGQIPRRPCTNLAGELGLTGSAAVMKGAVISFVNDSAPLHLATAVDAPVCAVFCSTVPGFGFGPLSTFSRVAETSENLRCRPCGLHGHSACPEGHFRCGHGIDTQQLLAAYHEAVLQAGNG